MTDDWWSVCMGGGGGGRGIGEALGWCMWRGGLGDLGCKVNSYLEHQLGFNDYPICCLNLKTPSDFNYKRPCQCRFYDYVNLLPLEVCLVAARLL